MAEISEENLHSFPKRKSSGQVNECLGKAILELKQIIKEQHDTIDKLESQNSTQSFELAFLHQQSEKTARQLKALDQQIVRLQEENHLLKTKQDSAQDELKMMVTEIWHKMKKQRPHAFVSQGSS